MSKLWLQGGKLLRDALGRLILCDACPCPAAPVVCRQFGDDCPVPEALFASAHWTFNGGCDGTDWSEPMAYQGSFDQGGGLVGHVWETAGHACNGASLVIRMTIFRDAGTGRCNIISFVFLCDGVNIYFSGGADWDSCAPVQITFSGGILAGNPCRPGGTTAGIDVVVTE